MTTLSHFAFCAARGVAARGGEMSSFPKSRRPGRKGFSLVEVIAVIAIIVIMAGLLAPAIKGITASAGRKGAVNVLMNTFEQARAAALETGANVYVVLWKRQFPAQDSVLVVRDALEWNSGETGLVPLTRWVQLPKGILLYDPPKVAKNLFKADPPSGFGFTSLPKSGGETPDLNELAIVKFTPMGTIQNPSDKDDCRLMIGEGFRGADGNETLVNSRKDAGLFDVITFRRFTGRASLDVSSLSSL